MRPYFTLPCVVFCQCAPNARQWNVHLGWCVHCGRHAPQDGDRRQHENGTLQEWADGAWGPPFKEIEEPVTKPEPERDLVEEGFQAAAAAVEPEPEVADTTGPEAPPPPTVAELRAWREHAQVEARVLRQEAAMRDQRVAELAAELDTRRVQEEARFYAGELADFFDGVYELVYGRETPEGENGQKTGDAYMLLQALREKVHKAQAERDALARGAKTLSLELHNARLRLGQLEGELHRAVDDAAQRIDILERHSAEAAKRLTFDAYASAAREHAFYPGMRPAGELSAPDAPGLVYAALGLNGEAGEVAEQVKKFLRDDKGQPNPERRDKLVAELGDVLWYLAACAWELEVPLRDIAKKNLEKLDGRAARGTLGGEGDAR